MTEWSNDKTAKQAVIDQLNDYIVKYNYAFETLEALLQDQRREVRADG